LRPLGLGDFLTGLPAYRGIRRYFTSAEILLACPLALEPLAALSGVFDGVVDTRPLTPLSERLCGLDVAINLHGRGSDSTQVLLDAGARRVIAFSTPQLPQTAGMARWRADEHEVHRWCRLLESAGIDCDPDELDLPVPPVAVPAFAHGATLIHPGAASESRRWPPERWSAVIAAERAAGREVILTGGPAESALTAGIARATGLPPGRVFAGETSLVELAALVLASGRVVCGDTGVAHVATAYRKPSVTLFGPTPPGTWGPPANRPYHRILWAGMRGDPHGNEVDPGLLRIAVDDVLAALATLGDPRPLTVAPADR